MADWLGHLIANWPVWIVIPIVIVVGLVWFFVQSFGSGYFFNSSSRHEWPEDKKKRLVKKQAKQEAKLKVKKG